MVGRILMLAERALPADRLEAEFAALARATSIRAAWNSRTGAWLARPAPRFYAAGRVEGTIGFNEPAVTAYLKLFELGIPASEEIDRRLLVARYFASRGRLPQAQEQTRRILAIAPDNAEAQQMVRR
jgi:hypothetical protein